MSRPELIVLNKVDLLEDDDLIELFKSEVNAESEIVTISAATRDNLEQLLYKVADLLDKADELEAQVDIDDSDHRVVYKHEKDPDLFVITRDDDAAYVVSGDTIERVFKMTDFNNEAAVRRFARQMRSLGIDDALRERGIENGDTVRILGGEFEFVE